MDFISRYVLRAAGFLVAAQVFLTFALTSGELTDKALYAAKLAMLPVPLLALGGFLTMENGLRAAGYTILLWAGAGVAVFFGAVYGDPDVDRIPGVPVPQASEVSLGFGFANLACVIIAGICVWLWGVKNEPAAGTYHSIG